eukprot:COSAG02_NODE_701_length_18335_cov_18.672955_8_plen_321_part_00
MAHDSPPLGELGWRGKFRSDSAEVQTLRTELADRGGIAGLELVDPAAPEFADAAARLFHRDGFVLVRDALSPQRAARIRKGCDTVIRGMVARDPERLGSRGSHRYAFANAPAHFGCCDAWACLVDNPVALATLEAIFGSTEFCCSGFGGDFVLPGIFILAARLHHSFLNQVPAPEHALPPTPSHRALFAGATEFQHLHRDMGDFLQDPTGRLNYLDLPCPQVVVNYPMIVVPEPRVVTTLSGATRQIPGTQNSRDQIPTEAEEPVWMKCSITAPVPSGCALFRDVRCWVTLCCFDAHKQSHCYAAHVPSASNQNCLAAFW